MYRKVAVGGEELVGLGLLGQGLLQDLLGESVVLEAEVGAGVGGHGACVRVLLHQLLADVDGVGVPGRLQADLHLHSLNVGVLGIGGLCQLQEVQRFRIHSVAGEDGRLADQGVGRAGVELDGAVERFHGCDEVPLLLLDASVGDPVGGVVHVEEDRFAEGLLGGVEVAELLVCETLGVPDLRIVLHEDGGGGEGGGCFEIFSEGVLGVPSDAADVLVVAVLVVVVLAELLDLGVLALVHEGGDEPDEIVEADDLGHLLGGGHVGLDAVHLEVGEDLRGLGVGGVDLEDGAACLDRVVEVAGLPVDVDLGHEGDDGPAVRRDRLLGGGGGLGGAPQGHVDAGELGEGLGVVLVGGDAVLGILLRLAVVAFVDGDLGEDDAPGGVAGVGVDDLHGRFGGLGEESHVEEVPGEHLVVLVGGHLGVQELADGLQGLVVLSECHVGLDHSADDLGVADIKSFCVPEAGEGEVVVAPSEVGLPELA